MVLLFFFFCLTSWHWLIKPNFNTTFWDGFWFPWYRIFRIWWIYGETGLSRAIMDEIIRRFEAISFITQLLSQLRQSGYPSVKLKFFNLTYHKFQLNPLAPLEWRTNSTIFWPFVKIWKNRKIWETPWFCWESLYCDTWLSESLVRHRTTPFMLF